jgi:hypothetical protein
MNPFSRSRLSSAQSRSIVALDVLGTFGSEVSRSPPDAKDSTWNRVIRSKTAARAGRPGLGGRPRKLTAERHPLQIRADFSYNHISGKDKKWARQPIFFCFFGFGGQRN